MMVELDTASGARWPLTIGVGLPTGAAEIAGRGVQPHLQFPWSLELHDGWGLSGMLILRVEVQVSS